MKKMYSADAPVVKSIIRKYPGRTFDEIVDLCSEHIKDKTAIPCVVQNMGVSGVIVVNNGKYYAIGPSSRARGRRMRKKGWHGIRQIKR